jgi:hypothetical protein
MKKRRNLEDRLQKRIKKYISSYGRKDLMTLIDEESNLYSVFLNIVGQIPYTDTAKKDAEFMQESYMELKYKKELN